MKTNFSKEFSQDSSKVKKMLESIGFVIKDEDPYGGGYMTFKNDNTFGVTVYPKLLYYSEYHKEGNFNESILSMWTAVRIVIEDEDNLLERGKNLENF